MKVYFGNNYSNLENFCITIGLFDTLMLHLSRQSVNSFSSKTPVRYFTNHVTISL